MAKDIETLSDADKLSMATALGMIVVESTTFTSPVTAIEYALPVGYSEFEFRGRRLQVDDGVGGDPGGGSLFCVFSLDDGATWVSDPDEEQAYCTRRDSSSANTYIFEAAARMTDDVNTFIPFGVSSRIDPGATGQYASVLSHPMGRASDRPKMGRVVSELQLDTGRVTNVRIFPDYGWVFDHDNASRIVAGSCTLFGIV